MSDIDDIKVSYDLVMKPKLSVEENQLAKIREQQRRERKQKLYSFSPVKVIKSVKRS